MRRNRVPFPKRKNRRPAPDKFQQSKRAHIELLIRYEFLEDRRLSGRCPIVELNGAISSKVVTMIMFFFSKITFPNKDAKMPFPAFKPRRQAAKQHNKGQKIRGGQPRLPNRPSSPEEFQASSARPAEQSSRKKTLEKQSPKSRRAVLASSFFAGSFMEFMRRGG